jgi:hypothetical protein
VGESDNKLGGGWLGVSRKVGKEVLETGWNHIRAKSCLVFARIPGSINPPRGSRSSENRFLFPFFLLFFFLTFYNFFFWRGVLCALVSRLVK